MELSVVVANNVTNLVNQEKQLADDVNNVEDELNGKSIKDSYCVYNTLAIIGLILRVT